MSREGNIFVALTILALIMVVVQMIYPQIPPYIGWPIVGILGILVLSFFIIGIRKKESQETLILTVRSWAIGLTGMTGYPKEPENAAWLRLEVVVNPIGKPIDTLDLLIGSETIPAYHWHGKIVTAFNVYFNVTKWQWKREHQVELIAKVGGKPHSSGRIPIDFNVEPGGFGRLI